MGWQALISSHTKDSKYEGASRVLPKLSGRKVIVGDGATDMELYEKGLTQEFIAYTGN